MRGRMGDRSTGALHEKDPAGHRSAFGRWVTDADIYIACHFWDPWGQDPDPDHAGPARPTPGSGGRHQLRHRRTDRQHPACFHHRRTDVRVRPFHGKEVTTGTPPDAVTVMAVDNLPCELPRDASDSFGHDLVTGSSRLCWKAGTTPWCSEPPSSWKVSPGPFTRASRTGLLELPWSDATRSVRMRTGPGQWGRPAYCHLNS